MKALTRHCAAITAAALASGCVSPESARRFEQTAVDFQGDQTARAVIQFDIIDQKGMSPAELKAEEVRVFAAFMPVCGEGYAEDSQARSEEQGNRTTRRGHAPLHTPSRTTHGRWMQDSRNAFSLTV
jgi:hypothetical protein